jgi:type II secretion system protein G
MRTPAPRANGSANDGFTLLELLIVVAIIAILASITVPNFLEAQTRSKVGRVHTDLHSLGLALEAYKIEHNVYPAYNHPHDTPMGDEVVEAYAPVTLTTPVAYAGILPDDPFRSTYGFEGPRLGIRYINRAEMVRREPGGDGAWAENLKTHFGVPELAKEWLLFSVGPDRVTNDGGFRYDPTNGTVSGGDVTFFGPH